MRPDASARDVPFGNSLSGCRGVDRKIDPAVKLDIRVRFTIDRNRDGPDRGRQESDRDQEGGQAKDVRQA